MALLQPAYYLKKEDANYDIMTVKDRMCGVGKHFSNSCNGTGRSSKSSTY